MDMTNTLNGISPDAPLATCAPPPHLWVDRPDARQRINELLQSGLATPEEASQLTSFCEQGFVIFPKAIQDVDVDALRAELLVMHQEGDKYLARVPREKSWKEMHVVSPTVPVLPPKSRLLDYYVNSERARNMVLVDPVTRFLQLVYQEPPLVFQSLLFTWGTEHGIHADNTYIVCDPPCSLTATWIALEDVEPGCGELAYYPGSHRHPLVVFGGDRIAWQQGRDGLAQRASYTRFLRDRARQLDGDPVRFHARKGDVMLWHGNLVHYGSKITLPNRTRYSVLTHYCPAESAKPNYFYFFPEAYARAWGNGFYSSRRYDLRPGVDNPYPVFRG